MTKPYLTHLCSAQISSLALAATASAANKTNVIVIMADDIGYECYGTYGGTSYPTPNIERMAAEGIRFPHCYSQPLCTPSRVKIMTGESNARNYAASSILKKGEKTFEQSGRGWAATKPAGAAGYSRRIR